MGDVGTHAMLPSPVFSEQQGQNQRQEETNHPAPRAELLGLGGQPCSSPSPGLAAKPDRRLPLSHGIKGSCCVRWNPVECSALGASNSKGTLGGTGTQVGCRTGRENAVRRHGRCPTPPPSSHPMEPCLQPQATAPAPSLNGATIWSLFCHFNTGYQCFLGFSLKDRPSLTPGTGDSLGRAVGGGAATVMPHAPQSARKSLL